MLVVTANWTVPDGTLVVRRVRSRARAWLRAVRSAAIRSGFGRDGVYRPPVGLDVVLAGDTLDGLVSAAWCGRERPWHGDARAVAARRATLAGCARRAAPLLAGLAALARRGLAAPVPDRHGRPSLAATTRVPVRVTLLPGDRDRHLADVAGDVAAAGIRVAPAWRADGVMVRHGHEFDPACHVDDSSAGDRPPTLAESVGVDLVARFAAGLRGTAAGREAADLVEALVDADVLGLPDVVSAWHADAGAAAHRDVVEAWRRAVDAWERAARRDAPDCGSSACPVEELAAWFTTCSGSPPAGGGWLDERVPRRVADGADTEVTVLGHARREAGRDRLVCLGRTAARPWRATAVVRAGGGVDVSCVAPRPPGAEPATIAVRRPVVPGAWWWLAGRDAPAATPASRGATVVDAA